MFEADGAAVWVELRVALTSAELSAARQLEFSASLQLRRTSVTDCPITTFGSAIARTSAVADSPEAIMRALLLASKLIEDNLLFWVL